MRRTPSFRLLVIAVAVAGAVFASAAAAEMPSNRESPTITDAGGPVVGETLLGNNGTWLYADGSACRSECSYTWAWQRCLPGSSCAPIPGATQRAYVVAAGDVRRTLRVAVTATKYDCNAHGHDCRHVSRTALSGETPAIAGAPAPAVRLAISGVTVTPAARRRLAVGLRVTDGRTNAVPGVRLTVRAPGALRTALTRTDGTAGVSLPRTARARAITLSIRAERPGAEAASLRIRVPVA